MYCRFSSFTSLFCTAPKSKSKMSARAPEALFELRSEAEAEAVEAVEAAANVVEDEEARVEVAAEAATATTP